MAVAEGRFYGAAGHDMRDTLVCMPATRDNRQMRSRCFGGVEIRVGQRIRDCGNLQGQGPSHASQEPDEMAPTAVPFFRAGTATAVRGSCMHDAG